MILKNKLTRETLEIPYSEFRKKFAKEIQDAFESYRKTQLNKYSWNFKDDNSLEFNFYFELQWNLRLGGRGLKRERACLMPPKQEQSFWNFSMVYRKILAKNSWKNGRKITMFKVIIKTVSHATGKIS